LLKATTANLFGSPHPAAAAAAARYKFVDRTVFRKLLTEALGNRALTQTHIDFLWQCYDR
jgi:hypothetical protein